VNVAEGCEGCGDGGGIADLGDGGVGGVTLLLQLCREVDHRRIAVGEGERGALLREEP
jgi:hypothetical protein